MLIRNDIPILEFDEAKDAAINPCDIAKYTGQIGCERLVITFFGEVIEELLSDGKIEKIKTVIGENPYVIYKFRDCDVLIMHGDLGCPAMGGELEELIAMGVKKVMFCGGGGVLDRETCVGHFLVVEGAIRDDGFSYHYIPASRIVYTEKRYEKAHLRLSFGAGNSSFRGACLDDGRVLPRNEGQNPCTQGGRRKNR